VGDEVEENYRFQEEEEKKSFGDEEEKGQI
jgi:hypothetical protein